MSARGTAAYDDAAGLPPLVAAAVEQARRCGFTSACLPSHGRLLQVLAGGVDDGVVGETGTGTGVGLAWLASGARPGTRVVSIDHDPRLAAAARSVVAGRRDVEVLDGDWRALREHGPFDLLVLDGGGQGKTDDDRVDPLEWLRPGGLLVVDDFSPSPAWPPRHDGHPDAARLHWLEHPRLLSTQVRTQPDAVTVVAFFPG